MSETTSGSPGKGAKKSGAKASGKKSGKKNEAKVAPDALVQSSQQAAQAPPVFDSNAFNPDQRAQIEALSMNLARAALTAQGAIAEMALRQAERPAALSPDPFHVAPALTQVIGRLAAQPERMMRAQGDLFAKETVFMQRPKSRADRSQSLHSSREVP